MISKRCSDYPNHRTKIASCSMKKNEFALLQPVQWRDITGYISFIDDAYLTICFRDIPLPESANSRWGRHYVNILVYPSYWHEIRCCMDENEKEGHVAPTSDLLQFGRCRSVGTAHKQNRTRKN